MEQPTSQVSARKEHRSALIGAVTISSIAAVIAAIVAPGVLPGFAVALTVIGLFLLIVGPRQVGLGIAGVGLVLVVILGVVYVTMFATRGDSAPTVVRTPKPVPSHLK